MTVVVRPDRVYRTSVLTPIVGYQPQMSVQAVAQQFTQGPPSGTVLQGLNGQFYGFRGTGMDNFKMRFRAFMCRVFGSKCEMVAAPIMAPIAQGSPGPANMEASMVAPQMQSQMALLSHLTQSANAAQVQGPLAAGMWALSNRRPFTYYYSG